jgi:hypothetical protein
MSLDRRSETKAPSAHTLRALVRHRGAIGAAAAIATLALWLAHVAHWHWPYRIGGIAHELPLLGAAAGAGLVAALLLARVVPLFRGFGAWASGAVVALAAFLLMQSTDPFVAERSWRYAPERCDFAAAFPARPRIVAAEAPNDAQRAGERALLTESGTATSYSAECLGLGRAIEAGDRARLLADAEARLARDAARLRLKVERLERDGERAMILHGVSEEGRDAANEPLLRRAQARVMLGRSSVLVLWTWTVLRGGESAPPAVARFHESARPADAPR